MDERSRRIAERFELPLIDAALLVIPVIVIEEPPASPGTRSPRCCFSAEIRAAMLRLERAVPAKTDRISASLMRPEPPESP